MQGKVEAIHRKLVTMNKTGSKPEQKVSGLKKAGRPCSKEARMKIAKGGLI
jgi:hypothetical protein